MEIITHPIPYISSPEEISNEEYHKGTKYKDFISSTQLKWYYTSPRYFQHMKEHPEEASISLKASMEGSVYHDLLASYVNTGNFDSFENYWFVFEPPINQTTKKPFGITSGKYLEAYDAAKLANPGKETTSKAEIDKAKKMINEMLYNNYHYSHTIRQLIDWGKAEQSCFCEYKGSKFKYRKDLATRTKIVDWKTTDEKDLHPETIAKIIIKFKYHISAAFYQFFEHQITGTWKPFYWVFQQKSAPFDVAIVSSENWSYDIIKDGKDIIALPKLGGIEFAKLLEQHLWCEKHGFYPGVSGFIEPDYRNQRIMQPPVPGWKKNELFNYYND